MNPLMTTPQALAINTLSGEYLADCDLIVETIKENPELLQAFKAHCKGELVYADLSNLMQNYL